MPYIIVVDPVVKGEEYDITRVITEVFPVEVQTIYQKYKDAFAGRGITPLTRFRKIRVGVPGLALRDALPLNLFFASFMLLAQAVAAPPLSSPERRAVQAGASAARRRIPASVAFLGDAGLLLVAIKPAAVADYELVIRTLQEALAKDTDPTRSRRRKGGACSRPTETDAKGNALYVHVMLPAVTGFDYRPSLLLDELVKELAPDLLSKYQDAFAMPPTKLNLTEFANMSVAPLPPPEKEPGGQKKPSSSQNFRLAPT